MKRKPLILWTAVFFLAQLLLGLWLLAGKSAPALDMVAVNEAVQSAAGQWEELESGQDRLSPVDGLDFSVLSRDGTLLAATRRGLSESIQEAAARRDVMMDVKRDGQVVGKVLIHNDGLEREEADTRRLLLFLGISVALEIALLLGYLAYLDRRVFRPFQKLKVFAQRVAGGDLDFPLEMDRGNVFGAFTESFDLMREELGKARAQERAANQSKKELVAKLSHDIKTPVASIEAVSELMEVSAKTKKEREQLGVIGEKSRQIDRLVSDLFHATLEELQELTVNPQELGSGAISDMLRTADYQRRAEVGSVPECMLVMDQMRLQQVFDNLVSNSYKYADTNLRISFDFFGGYLAIKIEDFGPGVPEDELPLLFEKFYRGKNTEGKSGAGLGLFISRYLLEKMDGKISCRNTEGGFCAEIFLKLGGGAKNN